MEQRVRVTGLPINLQGRDHAVMPLLDVEDPTAILNANDPATLAQIMKNGPRAYPLSVYPPKTDPAGPSGFPECVAAKLYGPSCPHPISATISTAPSARACGCRLAERQRCGR